jgi:hypothetical protein
MASLLLGETTVLLPPTEPAPAPDPAWKEHPLFPEILIKKGTTQPAIGIIHPLWNPSLTTGHQQRFLTAEEGVTWKYKKKPIKRRRRQSLSPLFLVPKLPANAYFEFYEDVPPPYLTMTHFNSEEDEWLHYDGGQEAALYWSLREEEDKEEERQRKERLKERKEKRREERERRRREGSETPTELYSLSDTDTPGDMGTEGSDSTSSNFSSFPLFPSLIHSSR